MSKDLIVSKEEVIAAVRECAQKLGRAPTWPELRRWMKPGQISRRRIRSLFGSYTAAMFEAGYRALGGGSIGAPGLLDDWAAVARAVGGLPSQSEYDERGQFSVRTYYVMFKRWTQIPAAWLEYVKSKRLEKEWADVLAFVKESKKKGMSRGGRQREVHLRRRAKRKSAEILYGAPVTKYGVAHEPTNEDGVLYLFGLLSPRLKLVVTHVQAEFPDCELMQEVSPGRWRRRLAELEFHSRNFFLHKHDPRGCDLIICWEHNWPECPVEVLELKKFVRELGESRTPLKHGVNGVSGGSR